MARFFWARVRDTVSPVGLFPKVTVHSVSFCRADPHPAAVARGACGRSFAGKPPMQDLLVCAGSFCIGSKPPPPAALWQRELFCRRGARILFLPRRAQKGTAMIE